VKRVLQARRKWPDAAGDQEEAIVSSSSPEPFSTFMHMMFRAHPWHGVSMGDDWPEVINAYIEIVPTDTVKYEMDKATGLLKIDRPLRFSNVCPAPYGLVPRTFCGERVAELFARRSGRTGLSGDRDPLDVLVLTEKDISHGDILLQALPIGGLSMLDRNEADDKIIAVMKDDIAYSGWRDIEDVPRPVVDRLRHYFLTYKRAPGSHHATTEITQVYGRHEAHNVIRASHEDYEERFPGLKGVLKG
jgi:inorganic pyrophosphatase